MKRKIFYCLFILFSLNVFAKENKDVYYFPYITGNILNEYNVSFANSSNYGNRLYYDKRYMSFLQLESKLKIHLTNNFALKTNVLFKPFMGRLDNNIYYYDDYYGKEDYIRRKNYFFNRYDLIFEELAFEYSEEQFLFGIGKFNPTFATAYDKSKFYPVFGTKIQEEYELTEKLGFYVAMTLPMVTLRGNFFYNDDTIFSRSIFNNRNEYDSKKGVANDHKINNFSITADFGVYDYRFSIGFRRLSPDKFGKAEKGYSFSAEKLIEESENTFGLMPLIEYVYISNFNGTPNRNVNYLTTRVPSFYGGWNITPSYTYKLDNEKGFNNKNSYMAQINIGYKFKNGLMLDVSKNFEKETYKTGYSSKYSYKINSTDLRLSYMFEMNEE